MKQICEAGADVKASKNLLMFFSRGRTFSGKTEKASKIVRAARSS
jgi:hypothetical protein